MTKMQPMTDEGYATIGRRDGSEEVAEEASRASARWNRDVEALGPYGHTRGALAAFETLRTEHARLRQERPDLVATKRDTIRSRDEDVAAAWDWVDKVTSILVVLARSDATVATRFREAAPEDDSDLEGKMGALAKILTDVKSRVDEDAQADARLTEVEGLRTRIAAVPGAKQVAKAGTVADTKQIDILDGKLYVTIRDLNSAARKAIRNGHIKAALSEYRFHRINRSGRPGAPAATDPTAPTPQ